MRKRLILGKEIEDDDIRRIAGARCWIEDGYIVKAKKVRATGDRTDAWIAKDLYTTTLATELLNSKEENSAQP